MAAHHDGSWFALRVKYGSEKAVSHMLRSKGIEQFLPVYRSKRRQVDRAKEVDLPLFPGYVFCRFKSDTQIPVVTTPGVTDIVKRGRIYATIDPDEIATLQALLKSSNRELEFYLALTPNISGFATTLMPRNSRPIAKTGMEADQ